VIVRPEATKVHGSPALGWALMLTVIEKPSASFICEAMVRIQISS
jgi:hypothetical protein